VSREVHAGFCERRRVKLPPPTLLVVLVHGMESDAQAIRAEIGRMLATTLKMTLSQEGSAGGDEKTGG